MLKRQITLLTWVFYYNDQVQTGLFFWTGAHVVIFVIYYMYHGHVVIHVNMFFSPAYKTVLDQPDKYSFIEIWAKEATVMILLLSDF